MKIDKVISHYNIIAKIGEGGMGIVYKAQDSKLNRLVAIKFLSPTLTKDESSNQRFVLEAQAASGLDHPNICTIYEINETPDGQLYICMAYYRGQTLTEKLAAAAGDGGSLLPVEEVIDITIQIAKGLQRAHEEGITHRDIKPANIIITNRGEVKILDFGLAKLAGQDITQSTKTFGTAAYMSPEQVQKYDVDHQTDIWSLGVVFYELLTGQRPFQGDSELPIMYSIVNETPKPLADFDIEEPDRLQHILDKALQKNPTDRYQKIDEILADLNATKQVKTIEFAHPSSITDLKSKMKKWKYIAAVTAFIALLFVLSISFFRLKPLKSSPHAIAVDKYRLLNSDTLSSHMLAVLPFSYYGSDEYSYLRDGIVEILSRKFDGAGDLRAVEPTSLLRATEVDSLNIDMENARAYASQFGAGLYVHGSILETNGRMNINASISETEGNVQAAAEIIVENETQLLEKIDELVIRLLTTMSTKPVERFEKVAGMTTTSLPALKKYLKGEHDYRHRRGAPLEAFREAVQIDSTFALAWFRLTQTAGWYFQYSERRKTMKKALEYLQRLPQREQLLLQAFHAHLLGEADQAERFYRKALFHYPNDIEALTGLGKVYYHYNMMRGGSVTGGRKYFEQALSIDSSYWEPLIFLHGIALMEGRVEELDSLTSVYYSGREIPLYWRSCLALFRNDTKAWRRIVEKLKTMSSGSLGFVARFSTLTWFDWASYLHENALNPREIFKLYFEPHRDKKWREYGLDCLGHFEVGIGRWSAAQEYFDRFSKSNRIAALESRALAAVSPFVRLSHDEFREMRDEMLQFDPETIKPSMDPHFQFAVHNDIHHQLRCYLLGLFSARLGKEKELERYADELENMERPVNSGSLIHDLGLHLRAELAVLRGNDAQALALLERTKMQIWFEFTWVSHLYSQIHSRFLRAELLKKAGRYEEALGWYVQETGFPEMLYTAPSLLRSAEIYQELGQTDEAIEYYTRFVRLWKNCDPELQPMLQKAKSQLALLTVSSADLSGAVR